MNPRLDELLRPQSTDRPRPRPKAKAKHKPQPAAEPQLSRQRKPPAMLADDWQRALRRQFGCEQGFELQNLADAEKGAKPSPVFSEFRVSNADSGGHYRVAIRGTASGDNLCTCPDFSTNDLGTCKHTEFTLSKLVARRGGKAALARLYAAVQRGLPAPWRPAHSALQARCRLPARPARQCTPALRRARRLGAALGAPGRPGRLHRARARLPTNCASMIAQ